MEKLSASLEDYLEMIYNCGDSVRAVDIARELNVSRASVAEALTKLEDKELIERLNNTITITDMGLKIAEDVVNRHSSLSSFFEDVLGANPMLAEENACRIEHIISAELLDRIQAFVKFARSDMEFTQEFKKFYMENLEK